MRAGGSRNAASRNTCTRRFSARIEANILPMTIRKVTEHKKRFLDLLLLADEQESMIDRYLERGVLYVLEDGGVKVGFNVDMMAGLAYEVTEKIAPYIEFGVGFGSSFAFDVRGGVMYRLGGGSSNSSGGGDSASAPAGEAGE